MRQVWVAEHGVSKTFDSPAECAAYELRKSPDLMPKLNQLMKTVNPVWGDRNGCTAALVEAGFTMYHFNEWVKQNPTAVYELDHGQEDLYLDEVDTTVSTNMHMTVKLIRDALSPRGGEPVSTKAALDVFNLVKAGQHQKIDSGYDMCNAIDHFEDVGAKVSVHRPTATVFQAEEPKQTFAAFA